MSRKNVDKQAIQKCGFEKKLLLALGLHHVVVVNVRSK